MPALRTEHVTPYDAIRYPGLPYADTHPDHLAAAGTLHGMTPAPPGGCRVLEIGCGDGGNLVPMAYGLPGSAFVGIDLAGDAIAAATAFARRAGVANVAFEALDLMRFPASAGVFDYIVAHGVYSWIPADARDALMALVGRHLAPQGIAFVSYNTLPGCHLRRMMWEMLRFHTAELPDAQSRLTEARALIRLVAHGSTDPDEYTQPLVAEAARMEERIPALLFHDDLSPINDAVYFHEFADHAARHGLQFLAESAFVSSSYAGISSEARGVLSTLDPITRQQYLDYIRCRRFRETLLCRDDVVPEREISPQRLQDMTFTAARYVRKAPADGDTERPVATSATASGGDAGTELMVAMLEVLRAAAPAALSLRQVHERIRARPEGASLLDRPGVDPQAIALASVQAGVLEPHVASPRLACPPGDRPAASAVVRAQLASGDVVASVWHQPVKVDDRISQCLLPLLDGTYDRRALLAAAIGAEGDVELPTEAAALDGHLLRLARLGLLVE